MSKYSQIFWKERASGRTPRSRVSSPKNDFRVDVNLCKSGCLIIEIFLSEVVLSIRTWAVWGRNRIIGVGLGALVIAHFCVQCVFATLFLRSIQYGPSIYPGYRGCSFTKAGKTLWVNYSTITLVEATVFVLMIISTYKTYKSGCMGKLSHITHRDGLVFYIGLLCVSVANTVSTVVLPAYKITFLTPLLDVLYPVLTTRIVLNIRNANNPGVHTEMHAAYEDAPPLDMPLQGLSGTRQTTDRAAQPRTSAMKRPWSHDNEVAYGGVSR